MSTAWEKEWAAHTLRHYAVLVEGALESLPALSAEAWDCPAADAFVAGVADGEATLRNAGATMRSVAASLEAAATVQRATEAAVATPMPPVEPEPSSVP